MVQVWGCIKHDLFHAINLQILDQTEDRARYDIYMYMRDPVISNVADRVLDQVLYQAWDLLDQDIR